MTTADGIPERTNSMHVGSSFVRMLCDTILRVDAIDDGGALLVQVPSGTYAVEMVDGSVVKRKFPTCLVRFGTEDGVVEALYKDRGQARVVIRFKDMVLDIDRVIAKEAFV
jgi:hypothetical protein